MTDHCLANFDCRLGSFSTMEEAPSRWNSRFSKTHCHKSCEGNFLDGWGASENEKEQPWPRVMIRSTSCQGVHMPCQQRQCRLCCGELQIAVWTVSPMQCTSLNCLRPRVPHVPWLGCGWGWPFFLHELYYELEENSSHPRLGHQRQAAVVGWKWAVATSATSGMPRKDPDTSCWWNSQLPGTFHTA